MVLPVAALVARRVALSAARGAKKAKRVRELRGARAKTRAQRKALGHPKMRDPRPYILSPEGIAMLSVALILDLVPPIFVLALDFFFGIGELISWPIDIFGTIVLGTWMYARGGQGTTGKKLGRFLKRRAPLIVGEYIPVVGALPFWTINVLFFLRK